MVATRRPVGHAVLIYIPNTNASITAYTITGLTDNTRYGFNPADLAVSLRLRSRSQNQG